MIGNIPDGWRVEKLKNIIHRAHQGINTAADKVEFDFQGYPIIQTRNITSGVLHFDNIKYVNKNDWDLYKKKYQPKVNDILLSNIGTIGKSVLINTTEDFLIHWNIFLIEPITNLISPTFLKKYFDKLDNENYYERFLKGGTVKFISKGFLSDLIIPIPPLLQQQKIVKVLDISSQLIEKQKELITEYDLFLKSKFIEMFGDPINNPMGWEVVKLGKYGTLARGKSAHRPRNAPFLYGGKYPFIQTGDITKGNSIYLKHYKQTYSEDGIKQSRIFLKDTIAITIAANIGDTKILSFDCYFPDSVVGFNVENPLFVSSLFSYYKIKLEQRATKTAQKNINLQILNNLDVLYPPIELQNKFASIVENIETIKNQENQKLEHLETLHKSLMDKAFRGEVI